LPPPSELVKGFFLFSPDFFCCDESKMFFGAAACFFVKSYEGLANGFLALGFFSSIFSASLKLYSGSFEGWED